MSRPSRMAPAIAVGWRRKMACSLPRCGTLKARAAPSSAGAIVMSVPDPGIEQRVADVDGEIDEHVPRREHQDDALDDGIVAPQDGVDDETADAGDGEYRLGDDDAGDEQRDADADDRRDRH